jgi:AsmA family protein
MRWKWIIIGFCGFIVIVIVAAYVILSTYDFNSLKPQITKAALDATGRELTLGGDIRLKIGLTPSLTVENVGFQNAPWGSRPEMAEVKRFEVQVALVPLIFGHIELKRVILVDPDILIETDRSGKSNLVFETRKMAAPQKAEEETPPKKGMKLPALVVNEFRITKGQLTYRDGQSGRTMVVALDSLTANASGLDSPVKLKLKGAYNGESLEAEGTIGPLAGLTGTAGPWPLKINAKMFGATLTLDGTIKDVLAQRGIDLGFVFKGNDLASLEKAFGKSPPLKGPFDVSGRLSDPAPKTYRISDLKAALGDSDLAGTAEVQMGGKRPTLTAVLTSHKLDMRSMLPESGGSGPAGSGGNPAAESAKATAKRDKIFPDKPLPLDPLLLANANVKIQAAQVLLPKIALNNLSLSMNLKDGTLEVKPFKALMAGGTLDAQLGLQGQGKVAVVSASMKIEQLDLGLMLKEVKGIESAEGRLDADINIKGRGSSVAGLMGSLDGKSVITAGKGKIDSKYINLLGGSISSELPKLLGLSSGSQYTVVNCLVSGFNIKDGHADTTALVLDTDQMSVVGDGEINLKNETLNLALNPSPKGGIGTGGTGKVTASMGGLAKAFKLSGTLAHPSLGIDTTRTAVALGKMIGGTALLGPIGLVAPLLSGSQTNQDLCSIALEAARKGVKMSSLGKEEKKKATGPAAPSGGGIEGLGKKLENLFGK